MYALCCASHKKQVRKWCVVCLRGVQLERTFRYIQLMAGWCVTLMSFPSVYLKMIWYGYSGFPRIATYLAPLHHTWFSPLFPGWRSDGSHEDWRRPWWHPPKPGIKSWGTAGEMWKSRFPRNLVGHALDLTPPGCQGFPYWRCSNSGKGDCYWEGGTSKHIRIDADTQPYETFWHGCVACRKYDAFDDRPW